MPKMDSQLTLAERYDKEAQEHIRKAIELGQAARSANVPAEREKYSEQARKEREAAISSLRDATIAFGPELSQLREDRDSLY